MMKSILFISYGFLESNAADTIQNKRLIQKLKETYDIDILCRSTQSFQNKIITCSTLDLSFIDRILFKIFPWLRPCISIDLSYWAYKAYKIINKRNKHYDYIINIHEPYALYKLGARLKEKSNSKLLSILYDPCYENMFFNQSSLGYRIRYLVERYICMKSDAICVNNDMVYARIKRRNPESNIYVVPLCSCDVPIICEHNNNEKFTIIHAGNIHGARTYRYLIQSIEYIKNNMPKLVSRLHIKLYGMASKVENELVHKSEVSDIISVMGCVPQDIIKCSLLDCDALMLIDPVDGYNYSFPSKLCEYFTYNKPIIGITSKNSVSYNVLKQKGHYAFDSTEIDYLSQTIISLVKNKYKNKKIKLMTNSYEEFLPENVTQKYCEILNRI